MSESSSISCSYPVLKTASADDLNYSHFSYIPIREGPPLPKEVLIQNVPMSVGVVLLASEDVRSALRKPLGVRSREVAFATDCPLGVGEVI